MDKIPERIFLRAYCECGYCLGKEPLAPIPHDEYIMWSVDRQNDNDVEYVLASKYDELKAELEIAMEAAYYA